MSRRTSNGHTTKADLIAIREEVQLLIDTLDDVEVGEE